MAVVSSELSPALSLVRSLSSSKTESALRDVINDVIDAGILPRTAKSIDVPNLLMALGALQTFNPGRIHVLGALAVSAFNDGVSHTQEIYTLGAKLNLPPCEIEALKFIVENFSKGKFIEQIPQHQKQELQVNGNYFHLMRVVAAFVPGVPLDQRANEPLSVDDFSEIKMPELATIS
jgi:hypothetical protein